MWRLLFLVIMASLLGAIVWLSFAFCRFHTIRKRLPRARWKRMLCGLTLLAIFMSALFLTLNFVNMVMVTLHLLFIWMGCDFVAALIRRFGRHTSPKHYYAGICAIGLTAVWLGMGWYNAHHISRTEYNLTSDKMLGTNQLKIIGLSDSHVGATFHHAEFSTYIDRINAEHPDIVVIMGDFVDDDTSKEDMEQSCLALGRLQTKYGVYYIYGNHDAGYWANSGRGYTLADLDRCLEENGVRILRDETVPVTGNTYICGRLDKSRSTDRKSASTLMNDRKPSDYLICLDHQPNDYAAEAASQMDLVISGHTHGGQFLGFGPIGVWMGANDAYYGHERRDNSDFIVSSGIGDWAIRFKTGCISEYVVINILGNDKTSD